MKYDENINQKHDILLKGFIKIHTETCLREDCPLTKFIKNEGNFNIQKQCLLNYMTIFFNNAMKKFPYNRLLKLYFVQFNFHRKYNLNSVRTNLEEIKKMKSDYKEEFIVYCLENEISKIKINDSNEGNEIEQEIINIDKDYKKLKELISKTTKLYVEFWGLFSTNTNNLNMSKLFKLGEKLNIYLKEIYYLWENNLKNKKMDLENEYIAQLYSSFLREIIWAKRKSEEIQKKINEEHQIQGFQKIVEKNSQSDNFDNILENQDYIIFVNSNEKGKCNIIQFSNGLTYLIGYQKQEIINKPLEILMPSLFVDGHSKKVEEYIKKMHFQNNIKNDSFLGIDNKKKFILIKNKMGYLIPFNVIFTIFDDNDFSNSFIIKAQLEIADVKSIYPYYILTNSEFNIESISSSAIHLGLTMDLLKKYVIKLNILVRTNKDDILNLFEKYNEYREEQKNVIWVYPDVIYPKNDENKIKDKPIEDLIKISNKTKFNLQIIEMKYNEGEILGFVFKFSDIQNNKNKNYKKEYLLKKYIPSFKNEILFDLLTLHYIRTIIIKKKSGFRNLREKDELNDSKDLISDDSFEKKKRKKKKEKKIDEDSSNDEKKDFLLTKDQVLELQTKDSLGIKTFINFLPFYGSEISLIKQRPNKEKYPVGKAQEPLIKIVVNNFTKRIDDKLKENPDLYKKIKNMRTEFKQKLNNENNSNNINFISSVSTHNEINDRNDDNINQNSIENSSTSLMNLFDVKSINLIIYIDYFIHYFIIIAITIEFILSFNFLIDNLSRFEDLSNSYRILSDVDYTKYFITEAILVNVTSQDYFFDKNISTKQYISYIKSELSFYRQEFSELFVLFSD